MLKFRKSNDRWWQKPLVDHSGRSLPAELVVLRTQLRAGETGAWLNSRSKTSGVVDLRPDQAKGFKTVREELPSFVSEVLQSLYEKSGLANGVPDLVVWNSATREVRLIEVKCPQWDRLDAEQLRFLEVAQKQGIPTSIIEWEFC